MRNRVEERLDIEVEHPVISPAALTRRAHGIDRRAAWSVTIGVRVEQRVQSRLQIPADNLLRDSIRHRWDSQRELHMSTVSVWGGSRSGIPSTHFGGKVSQ